MVPLLGAGQGQPRFVQNQEGGPTGGRSYTASSCSYSASGSWGVNHKRVKRIWRQEGLKVPERQPKRGRLWLNDGSCIRLRPLYRGHVWSYDFVASRTHDERALKLLTVLDEHTRECLAIVVARKIRSHDVLEVLADLFVRHGPPEYLRSDNGPEVHREARSVVVGARGR